MKNVEVKSCNDSYFLFTICHVLVGTAIVLKGCHGN